LKPLDESDPGKPTVTTAQYSNLEQSHRVCKAVAFTLLLEHYCSNTTARTLSIGWVTCTNITEKMVEEDNLLPPLLRDFLGATTLLRNGQGAAHFELR
jgi:hypothetical protein